MLNPSLPKKHSQEPRECQSFSPVHGNSAHARTHSWWYRVGKVLHIVDPFPTILTIAKKGKFSHHNISGTLRAIDDILAGRGINIERQVLDTPESLGYAIYDINRDCDAQMWRNCAPFRRRFVCVCRAWLHEARSASLSHASSNLHQITALLQLVACSSKKN
jgi:hypothetical protein